MDGSSISRIALRWLIRIILALGVGFMFLAAAVALGERHMKGPLLHFLRARTGREIRIAGSFEAHLLSLHPRLSATKVVIGNPPWAPAGTLADIGTLSLTLELARPPHWIDLTRLEMDGASLHLTRDAHGNANWQWVPPRTRSAGPPLIRSLSMPAAHVELTDAVRHLQFSGTASAAGVSDPGATPFLHLIGSGRLNGRAATFAINGDPLATVSRERAYRFAFDERSGGSRLQGRGSIDHAFDFGVLNTSFAAAGPDMRDLYFLTGIRLPDTGVYRLSGRFARNGLHFLFSELAALSGQSDMSGTLSIDSTGAIPRVEGALSSRWLRVSDIGARAAGRAPPLSASTPLLPDTPLPVAGIRHTYAVVRFHASGLGVGRSTLHSVAALVRIEPGILAVTLLEAELSAGHVSGRARFDARAQLPRAELDLRARDVQLGAFDRKHLEDPSFDGLLSGRVQLQGEGKSIHELAERADGTLTAVLPHGAMRASVAELMGLDVSRGLGLILDRNHAQTPIRCGVASFDVHQGVLDARTLVVDTDKVVITGNGTIHLDSETVDLALRGEPKSLRLMRVRSPIWIRGPLRHPKFALDARHVMAQTGAAVALGIVLTPLAAMLAFVDPGLAKDADCAALLARSGTKTGQPSTPAVQARH
ncbi:MAG TPA: AsmA family protein [Steroidobacteraceae bacterium]